MIFVVYEQWLGDDTVQVEKYFCWIAAAKIYYYYLPAAATAVAVKKKKRVEDFAEEQIELSAIVRNNAKITKMVTSSKMMVFPLLLVLSSLVSVTSGPSPRHPNQRELRYVVQEELLVGSDIGDIADDAGLVDRYGPTVARSALRFRFLATPRVPVEVDELTGRVRTTGRLDREAICGDGGDHMELCLDRLDVAVQPMNYFQIIKVYTHTRYF